MKHFYVKLVEIIKHQKAGFDLANHYLFRIPDPTRPCHLGKELSLWGAAVTQWKSGVK
jgi:hypothetical protein